MNNITKLEYAGTTSVEIFAPREVNSLGTLQFVSGTGTLVVEGSLDNGTTYGALALQKSDGTYVASVNAAGVYHFNPGACGKLRVRCSAFTADIVAYAGTVAF